MKNSVPLGRLWANYLRKRASRQVKGDSQELFKLSQETKLDVAFVRVPLTQAVQMIDYVCKKSGIEVTFECRKPEHFEQRTITLESKKVSILDLLDIMTEQTGAKYQIIDGKVIFELQR